MTESTDPKGAAGAAKTQLQLIPPAASRGIANVLSLGASKYGIWNWRENKVARMTYVAAIKRHLDAWVDGQDLDEESGESHIAHIGASACILLDAEDFGTLVDDRPPRKPSLPAPGTKEG